MYCHTGGRREGRGFMGILLLTFGVLMLLSNLNVLSMRMVIYQWWPLILLAFGLKYLIAMRGSAAWIGGLFWMGTGALFLGSTLGYLEFPVTRVIWPLMVIWFGVLIALGETGRCGPAIEDRSDSLEH
jgi:hypothetical protein